MILVDIGNTNINFAWGVKDKISRRKHLPNSKITHAAVKKVISEYPKSDILVSSVVPKYNIFFRCLKNVYFVGKDIKVPIVCDYDKNQVGMDRLLGAWAAKLLFPRARMVIDFGTAITFDFISVRGAYQGGIILPGIGSTLYVLSGCALLPNKIKLKTISASIPRNTSDSIAKGINLGFTAMINGLVSLYRDLLSLPKGIKVIITGGDAKIICMNFDFPYQMEPDLVLKGLNILGHSGCAVKKNIKKS